MENIVIKLAESTNAKVFSVSDSNLIHLDEFNKAKEWIKERIDKIKKGEISEKERLHDTITILGSRGSGKTSFLYSLLGYCEEKKDVEVIETIDPTLIEEKGHIFLTIISQIADVVEKKLAKNDCNPESKSYLKKNKWKEKLKSLAAGIPSIDGIGGNYDSWQDPEFIMDKGLRSVRAAKKLESDFHELLKLGLEILEKKVFIIALDDIDIDFRKGWPILETIRKYLTSPYIITLLSGDLKLFSKAIRKQQWKNFGKALLKNEGEQLGKMTDYEDLVTEMEGQYLQKVIQPQRRIHLTTIQEKINIRGKEKIGIYINENKEENRIDIYYNNKLSKFGINNPYQAEAYRSFLLSLPIRTQIQFLAAFQNVTSIKEVNVIDAFLSDLYEKRIDVNIAKSSSKYLDSVILKLLIQNKVLDEAYQLQPTTTDISLNSSLIALGFLFSQKTIDCPYLIFDYLLRVGYIRNLLSILGYQSEVNKIVSEIQPSIQGLCKHSSIYFDKVYRDILGSMTAYIRAFLNIDKENTSPWGGTIPIYALAETAKGKGDMNMRIDYIFKSSPSYKRQIAYLPVSISQPNDKQSSYTTYSIYVLLASIGEIIKQQKEGIEFGKTLSDLSQIRSYAMPGFKYNSVIDNEEEMKVEGIEEDETTDNNEELFKNSLLEWIQFYEKQFNVDNLPCNMISPHILGKISTRLFYALRTLEDSGNIDNLGDAMHNRIIILYNTVLLEETREVVRDKVLNNNNPQNSIRIFKENIFKCKSEDFKKLPLFVWIFSCPILLSFLNNENVDIVNIKKHINMPSNITWDKSIYKELKDVKISTSSTTKSTINIKGQSGDSYIKIITNNHQSISMENRAKLDSLYHSEKNIHKTIKHLNDNKDMISYNTFMNEEISTLLPKLRKIFARNVNKKAVESARKHIKNNKVKSW
jgi:hypothetical protein